MNGRQVMLAWLVAFCVCAGMFGFLVLAVVSNPKTQVEIRGVEVNLPRPEYVIIGSSLTGAAFAPRPGLDDVPWQGVTQRWHVNGMTDWVLLGMIDAAMAQDVDVILAEAGPLVRLPTATSNRVSERIVEFSRMARRGLIETLGTNTLQVDQSALLAESQFVDDAFERRQPSVERLTWGLRSYWSRASSSNWLQNVPRGEVDIVLMGFPRPESSGSSDQVALRDQERQFARNVDIAYFETEVFWDDAFFADASHLNAAGRARYMTEFRTWWNAR